MILFNKIFNFISRINEGQMSVYVSGREVQGLINELRISLSLIIQIRNIQHVLSLSLFLSICLFTTYNKISLKTRRKTKNIDHVFWCSIFMNVSILWESNTVRVWALFAFLFASMSDAVCSFGRWFAFCLRRLWPYFFCFSPSHSWQIIEI